MITHLNDGSKDDFIKEMKSFINGRLDELCKSRSNCEFRISNIVNQDHFDANDEYDMEKIHKIQMEIRVLIGSINAYEEMLKELA